MISTTVELEGALKILGSKGKLNHGGGDWLVKVTQN